MPRYPVLPVTARTSVSSPWPPSPRARSLLAAPVPDKTSPLLYRCGSIAVRHTPLFLYLQTRCIDRSGDTFPADDVLTPVPDRSRGDRRPGYLWGTRARAGDVSGQHSGGPGGIRAANPAG